MKELLHTWLVRRCALIVLPAALGSACFLGGSAPGQQNNPTPSPSTDGGQPFIADSPFVYVAKVKNLLTGLPPTQAEVDAVANASSDASKQAALLTLIDQWMTTPEYSSKMLGFFERAFQQTQISNADFLNIIPNGGEVLNSLVQNITESFARTMLELVAQGQPVTTAFTTNQLMMTPALMELYAYLDASQAEDNESVIDSFALANPKLMITLEDTTNILPSDSANPASPSYMNWYFPGLSTLYKTAPACNTNARSYPAHSYTLHNLMYGYVQSLTLPTNPPTACPTIYYGTNAQFTATDFSNWNMVTIRPPKTGESTTAFWDLNGLRNATELVINTPRLGFFSTPAFQANWQTNTSNEMRVTVNQSFIVALGAQVDGTDPTNPGPNPPGLDQVHTSAGAPCVGCHQTLDPSRSILQATYSYGYGQQATPALQTQKGWFVFNGVINKNIQTLGDFGTTLATHPLFPAAWVQKLCYYANSRPCAADDPEFQRIVSDFTTSGFQWTKLVEDLFSSPITTNAVETATASELGEVVSVSRRDHICGLLDARLNLVDACQLLAPPGTALTLIGEIAAGMPSDGYGRGAPVPVLPAQPTLFYRAGLENVCEDIANEIIDATSPPLNATTYSSKTQAQVDAAIADFVGNLMGIVPDDPRSSVMNGMLTDHYNSAIAQQAFPENALKSTFITACLSFTVAGIGM